MARAKGSEDLIITLLIIVLVFMYFQNNEIRTLSSKMEAFHKETLEKEREERIDLNNRLMSKDLADYSHNSKGNIPPRPTKPVNFLQAAREQAFNNSVYESSHGGDDD